MRDLNVDFLEKYKKVDKFIKDAYQSTDGVSEYLRQMDAEEKHGKYNVRDWCDDYKELRQVRWLRNQLSHELSIDTEIVSQYDYEWLNAFYERLMNATDPLSKAHSVSKDNTPQRPIIYEPVMKLCDFPEYTAQEQKKSSSMFRIVVILGIVAAIVWAACKYIGL